MPSKKCPYCNETFPLTFGTSFKETIYFNKGSGVPERDSDVQLSICKCPNCHQYLINIEGIGDAVSDVNLQVRPLSSAIQFPEYVPEGIRQDYEEACAIVNLSPKASATLSRRCIQSMIRDFWNITDKTLMKEIDLLEYKIPATQKKVLQSLRQIGNIGAHPETDVNTIIDVEPKDAGKLIKVIEFFIDKWYIDRHEQECLFDEINTMNSEMQAKRFFEE